MFHIASSIMGGVAALTAWALVAPGFDPASHASQPSHEYVNRTAKGDRFTGPAAVRRDATKTVTTVEVVGLHDAAIIYRDRQGNELFRTDPLSNVTVISKGFVLPRLTVRETPHSVSKPLVAPQEPEAAPVLPVGCEPAASPIVEPQLARMVGRCISQLEDAGAPRAANG